jgi:hypothetical protein
VNRRRDRQAQVGQAVIETVIVVPILIVLVLGFLGGALLMGAVSELRSATVVATASAFGAPAGSPGEARADVLDSFQRSVHDPRIVEKRIVCPRSEGNEYLYARTASPRSVVSCHGQATVSFANSVIGLVWRWDIHLSQDATVPVPPYRQCAGEVAAC